MPKRILLVDDAAFMRNLLKSILSTNDYIVVGEASDGIEGFEKYQELRPDIVLLDITMAKMDGLECLKKIKAFDYNAKVIMCSAMGQQAMVVEAIQNGAKDFIVKPFQADRVLDALRRIK